jgi:hypothetical protein
MGSTRGNDGSTKFKLWEVPAKCCKNNKRGKVQYCDDKCSVLEMHIPRRSAKNIMKSTTGKYRSIRARSTCIHNRITDIQFWKCSVFHTLQ